MNRECCPPSLSQDGTLRQGKKSDLLDCLISSVECCSDVIILDGAALVDMLQQLIARYLMTTKHRSSYHILKSSWSEQTGCDRVRPVTLKQPEV